MDPAGFPALFSQPTSTSGSGPVPDRPEWKLDQPEAVLPSQSTGMVLRSQSRTGRLEVVKSAEIHPEWSGGAPRPEPEIARPEVEDAPRAGRDQGVVSSSPTIDSSGETIETPSGPSFPARQEPETASVSRPSPHSTQTKFSVSSIAPSLSFTNMRIMKSISNISDASQKYLFK